MARGSYDPNPEYTATGSAAQDRNTSAAGAHGTSGSSWATNSDSSSTKRGSVDFGNEPQSKRQKPSGAECDENVR